MRGDVFVNNPKVRFLINLAFYATIITLFFLALQYILPLVMPFVIAFVIASLVQPITRFINKIVKFIPKKLLAGLFILIFYGTIGVGVVYLCIWLVRELVMFVEGVPDFIMETTAMIESATQEDIANFFSGLPVWMGKPLEQFTMSIAEDVPGKLVEYAQNFKDQLLPAIGDIGTNTVGAIIKLILDIPGVVVVVIVTIIATFFIGIDYDNLTELIMKAFPKRARPTVEKVKRYAADTVAGLLKTYILLMTLTFAELALGFSAINLIGKSLGIEIEYVVLLALLIAIVDILPVLGVGAVLIPWGIIDFIIGEWQMGLMVLVLYIFITLLRNYLEPKIIGTKYGMHPLITLIAIYVGGQLFGVIGIFALPLTCIILKRLYDVGAIKKPFDDGGDEKTEQKENDKETETEALAETIEETEEPVLISE